MINEEMQKTMQFILERQAQFAINMQKLDEKQLQAEARVTGVEERMTKTTSPQSNGPDSCSLT